MKKLINSKLFLQVIVASIFATLATAGIVGAVTTIGTNISTGGTFSATATSTVNGIIMDTNKFIVEDSSGNTTIGGTLSVTGNVAFANASSTGTTKLSVITSDTGAISFDNENLTTTGNLAFATASSTGDVKLSSITSDTAGISFNSKNLTSIGNIAFDTASSTGAVKVKSLGIASTSPMTVDLAIGTATATSTIATGKFCMLVNDQIGRSYYVTLNLASSGASDSLFATSTIPCNQ